jgi:hypothetical protein
MGTDADTRNHVLPACGWKHLNDIANLKTPLVQGWGLENNSWPKLDSRELLDYVLGYLDHRVVATSKRCE